MRLWSLLLAAPCALAVCLPAAGAEPRSTVPTAERRADNATGPAGGVEGRRCEPAALPAGAPGRARQFRVALAVTACLGPPVSDEKGDVNGISLRAAALTVTGLYCPPLSDTCRASAMEWLEPRVRYGGGKGAGWCSVAERLTITGSLRFRASVVRGRVFGVLPLAVSTRTVPPVPVPYLVLEDVVAHGLWARAGHVAAAAMTFGPGHSCDDAP